MRSDLLLAVSVLFLVLPVIVSVVLSFDDRQFLGPFPPTQFSLRWYRSFLENPAYLDGLIVSLKLAVLSTVISTVAGACAAYVISAGRWRGRDTVEMLFLSPKFVPTVVIGFSILGFASAIQMFDPFTRLIMGHVVITIPFTVRATLASLVGITRSLVEAAISLGAPPWRAFLDMTLPLARTGIVAGAADGVRAELRRGRRQPVPVGCLHADTADRAGRRDAREPQSHGRGGRDRLRRRLRS